MTKQRTKKPKKEEQIHQHIDKSGVPFGKSHPIDAVHKRESTQEVHVFTIKQAGVA